MQVTFMTAYHYAPATWEVGTAMQIPPGQAAMGIQGPVPSRPNVVYLPSLVLDPQIPKRDHAALAVIL